MTVVTASGDNGRYNNKEHTDDENFFLRWLLSGARPHELRSRVRILLRTWTYVGISSEMYVYLPRGHSADQPQKSSTRRPTETFQNYHTTVRLPRTRQRHVICVHSGWRNGRSLYPNCSSDRSGWCCAADGVLPTHSSQMDRKPLTRQVTAVISDNWAPRPLPRSRPTCYGTLHDVPWSLNVKMLLKVCNRRRTGTAVALWACDVTSPIRTILSLFVVLLSMLPPCNRRNSRSLCTCNSRPRKL